MTMQSDLRSTAMKDIRDDKRPRVIICGGGLAGLSAAKMLLDSGFSIELLEGRSILGGKVSSWRDSEGDWIESGLHVFFGAYVEIFKLMRELGIYENILWKEHILTYTLEHGERFAFRTANLPSPLHLVPAVFGQKYFTLSETLTAIVRIVYFLGDTLCPLPNQAIHISHYSTAVCPLCYGALVGLTVVTLSFPFHPPIRQKWEHIPWQRQLLFITCYLLPWLGDYVANKTGLLLTPGWGMYLLGFPGGLAVGMLCYFVPGATTKSQA
jgi:Flavin containing amine oxidoreductase